MTRLSPELEAATDRWFLRRGIPHFIDGYNARDDVFTRALPVVSVVFVLEVLVAMDTDWSWWQNTSALAAGALLLAGAYATVNRLRGRPAWSQPDKVGTPELLAFVVLPALLPLVIGGRWRGALLTMGFNILLLFVAYVVLSYGLIPMFRWAVGHVFDEVGGILRLMARSLPLVLIFSMFIFLNAEMWQVAADFTPAYFGISVGVLLFVASTFVLFRLPREVDALRRFESWPEICGLLADSPLTAADAAGLPEPPDPPRLSKADWVNVGLIWWFSQLVQILLVGVVITAFYIGFGVVTVRETTILQWTTDETVSGWGIAGTDLQITWELVTVSAFIGAFSALQFAISAVTDDAYREEFLTDLVHELRESFAVRALYLARLGVTRRH